MDAVILATFVAAPVSSHAAQSYPIVTNVQGHIYWYCPYVASIMLPPILLIPLPPRLAIVGKL